MERKFSLRSALSLIVVLAMMLSSVAVFALNASADDAVIGLDRANHYDWTQKDFESDAYAPTAASAGEVLVAASATETDMVGDRFGGNYFTWWYAILAEFDADADAFVISEIDLPGDGDGKPYEAWTLGEGKLVVLCNTGYASTTPAGNADDAAIIKTLAVGDVLVLDGIAFADLQAASGALEGVTITVVADEADEGEGEGSEGEGSETEPSEPVASENVAAGKTYTTSEQFRMGGADVNWGWDENADVVYVDEDGKTLTDGILPAENADYTAIEWAGWTGQHPHIAESTVYNWMIIDLGESYDLSKFVVWHSNAALGNGISCPEKIEVFVSEDGETWGEEAVASFEPVKDESVILTESVLEGEATGRYVQFKIHTGHWTFLGELEVYNKGTDTEGGNTEQPPVDDEPTVSLEDELKEFVGEAAADAKFDLEINAPETYKAGDEITVTVTVKNITAENGLHVVNFNLYYDEEKLVLTNDLDEEEDNRLLCIDDADLPSKWENFTKVNNDFDPANAEGTEVKALNDGVIYASALTDKDTASTAIKEDGAVVFTFTFTAVEDAEGDIGIAIPNAEVEGALNNAAGAEKYAGNGGYAIIADAAADDTTSDAGSTESDSSDAEEVVPGDASSMIVFAIIALVAIAGSAVVIKTRR